MGKLYSYTYVSVDGVMESPEKWTGPFFSDDLAAHLQRRLETAAGMVLGRITYEEFAAFWPTQPNDDPFVSINNSVRKFVVSDSLDEAPWNNSHVVRGSEVAGLKADSDGDLHITGSASLVRRLLGNGTLDELHLLIFPIVLGGGKGVFDGLDAELELELLEALPMPNGVISMRYAPKR